MTITSVEISERDDTAKCVVCELTGRWGVALRSELRDSGIRVSETRSFDECQATLDAAPASLAIVELTAENSLWLAETIVRERYAHPRLRIAVVADRAYAAEEWLMREAGAIHFLTSPRRIDLVAQIVHRHFAQIPPPQLSAVERIWASLPWTT